MIGIKIIVGKDNREKIFYDISNLIYIEMSKLKRKIKKRFKANIRYEIE